MNPTVELLKVKANLTLQDPSHAIEENEVPDLLGNEFPSINPELEKTHAVTIYKSLKCFADLTRQLAAKGNIQEVKHCFNVAEKMLCEGNSHVKNAVVTVYLFSMSTLLDFATPLADTIRGLMSGNLKAEYKRQVLSRGV